MRTADFDFDIPSELVAQKPAARRDASRLLVLHRDSGILEHQVFGDFPNYLRKGDVLVLNNSRVIPASLRGVNAKTGGRFDLLLLEEVGLNDWWVMLRPGKRARNGTRIVITDTRRRGDVESESGGKQRCSIEATVLESNAEGHRRLRFTGVPNILSVVDELGEVPLPPYIQRSEGDELIEDRERYQTVFAGPPGSVAAPTAGLHFTRELLEKIRGAGVEVCFITLHVGFGTFAPVKNEDLSAHLMHEERYDLSQPAAQAINRAKAGGSRVVAVGTTTLRALETASLKTPGSVAPGAGRTRIFIYPPYEFKVVNGLLTNFHLPRSTLLMLVSAFAEPEGTGGLQKIRAAYAEAVAQRYRFFSYGDAMLLI
jgi:S-adenosylmethionine:tRNA ribosyltransferase-isomerase